MTIAYSDDDGDNAQHAAQLSRGSSSAQSSPVREVGSPDVAVATGMHVLFAFILRSFWIEYLLNITSCFPAQFTQLAVTRSFESGSWAREKLWKARYYTTS